MIFNQTTVFKFRTEFEDLDAGGVVHHPKYLMFLERARTSAMTEQGYSFGQCLRDGLAFVVAETHLKFQIPARYEQELFVLSRIVAARRSSLKIFQSIVSRCPTVEELNAMNDDFFNLEGTLFIAQLRLVGVSTQTMKPVELPEILRRSFHLPDANYFVNNPDKQKTSIG